MKINLKNLKIAIISSSAPPFGGGGISSAHYNLYCCFKENGFNVVLFTFGDNVKTKHLSENEIRRFGTPKIILQFINLLFALFRVKAYQVNGVIASQIGSFRLSFALRNYNPDVIIVSDHGSPLLAIRKPKKSKVILVSHHNPLRFINEPLWGHHSVRDAKLASKIECYTLKKVDAVICPSNYMKAFFTNSYKFNGLIEVIPNIISEKNIENVTRFALHEKLGLHPDAPIIYIPSAGSIYKGNNYVFEIIRRLSNANNEQKIGFYLSGQIDALLKRELSFLKSDAVVFTPGQVSYFDNISYIKNCSFCISPTLIESFGMAILEANFCELPVITFNVGGNADIIKDGINGYLIDLLDIENMINKAQQLLGNNELLKQMRDNSMKFVMDNFSSNVVIESYIKYAANVSLKM